MHIVNKPPFIAQNEKFSSFSFHTASGNKARRHTSIRPMPSIP